MTKKQQKPSLYDLLGVAKTASKEEIRRQYRVLVLKVHPDKLSPEEKAKGDPNEAFRALQRAYEILSDPRRRELYDRTGTAGEDSQSFQDAYAFYRGVEITPEDIESFEKYYRGSKDEEDDLREFFMEQEGDVTNALAHIIGSRDEDIPRYVEFWTKELEAGRLDKSFSKSFMKSKRHIKTTSELDASESVEDLEDGDDKEEEKDDSEESGDDENSFIAGDDEEVDESDDDEDAADRREPLKFTPGDFVEGKWRNGKKWYAAEVLAAHTKDRTYDLLYTQDNVKELNVPANLVRALKKKPAKPSKSSAAASGEDELRAMILARAQNRQESFIAAMESKFAPKNSKKKAKSG